MGAFGIRGWVRITSYTDPSDNLFKLSPLQLVHRGTKQTVHISAFQPHKQSWVAQIEECQDRDQALALSGADLEINRDKLPALPENQYYWVDLQGLEVINLNHQKLGHIDHLFATGANDVIVVKQGQELHYIPYVSPEIVKEVDLTKKIMLVDWE